MTEIGTNLDIDTRLMKEILESVRPDTILMITVEAQNEHGAEKRNVPCYKPKKRIGLCAQRDWMAEQ